MKFILLQFIIDFRDIYQSRDLPFCISFEWCWYLHSSNCFVPALYSPEVQIKFHLSVIILTCWHPRVKAVRLSLIPGRGRKEDDPIHFWISTSDHVAYALEVFKGSWPQKSLPFQTVWCDLFWEAPEGWMSCRRWAGFSPWFSDELPEEFWLSCLPFLDLLCHSTIHHMQTLRKWFSKIPVKSFNSVILWDLF